MEVQLAIEQPNGTVSQHRFTEEPITVGSGLANHVVFEDPDLAAHQLILFREKGRWVIRNLAQGVEVQCDNNLLPPGETLTMKPESRIQMGSYAIDWCSEAPPEDAQKELARPRVLESAAIAESSESTWASGSEASGQETADAPSSDLSGDIFDEFNEDTPSDMHSEIDSESEAVMDVAEGFSEEEEEQELMSSEETSTSEMEEEEPTMAFLLDQEVPDDSEPGGEVEEANNFDFTGEETGSDFMPQEQQEPNPFMEDPLPITETTPRVTIQGYDRMRPFRTYPLLVNITHTDTMGQPVDATGCDGTEGPVVRFVPSLPGCVVTPASARADLACGAAGLKFWVTPVATGRFEDARMHVMWEGRNPAQIQMPLSLVRSSAAKIWTVLALVMGLLALYKHQSAWDVDGLLTRALPDGITSPLLQGVEAMGGAVNFGLAFTGLFLALALVAYLMRKTRTITLTTTPPQE